MTNSLQKLREATTREEVQVELAKRSLIHFMEYDGEGQWKRAKHLELLTDTLQSVSEDTAKGIPRRVIVTLPPRHGKSEVISKKFPAWHLGKNPEHEIIMGSYAADLALDHSRIARATFSKHGENLFEQTLARDSASVGRWGIEGHRGGLVAVGVGGPITGRGGHILLLDDPIKNAEEAHSMVIREKVWNWYTTTFYTRLAPGGSIVVVMTRWHEDDPVGRLLKQEEEAKEAGLDYIPWEVINLPAIALEDDLLGRKPGEALWPERFDINALNETKRVLGSYSFGALYQQKPSPAEGNIFNRNWWKYYEQRPQFFDEVFQSWDCSFKDKDTSDFVVGQVWGRKGADKYLLDQVRDRMDLPATMKAIESLSSKWPQARAKYIEDKANGPAVIQMLKGKVSGLIEVNPEGGKVVRARAISPDVEAGNVYLPSPSIAPWVHDFVEECSAFPNGAFDDQVDAMSQALIKVRPGQNEDALRALAQAKIYR